MMGMFLRESEEAPAEVSEEPDPDAEEQATTAQEEEETDSDEAESEEEEPDEGEPDEDDVLSELKPNAAKRARKRIDKLTARTKEAEERLQQREQEFQQLQQRLETLERGGQESKEQPPARFIEQVEKAESPEQLTQLMETARMARDWVDDNIDEGEVELNGVTYDRDQMKAIRRDAKDVLEKGIPQRAQYLQQRQQFEQSAVKDFPAWKDTDHPDHKLLQEIWNDPVAQETFRKMPNGRYLASVFAEGLKVIRNKGKKETQEKEEPKPKKKQAVAPKVPGVDDNYAPSETASDSDYERAFQEKTSLSQEDLVAYFARKERAKRK